MFLGRVVRPGVDAAWLDTDRGYALAWQANSRATCSCGTRMDEWHDDEDAYISDHWTCPGCQRIAEEQAQNLDRGADNQVVPGQHVYLEPRELHAARIAALPPPSLDD